MVRRLAALLAVAVLLTASACSDDDGDATDDPTTTAPATEPTTESTTTTEPLTDEELITQLEEEWWQALREISAGERPIEDAEQFLAEGYLDGFLSPTDETPDYVVLSDESSLTIGAIDLTTTPATVDICMVDADVAPGDDVSASEALIRRFRDSVVETDEGWRIVQRGILGEPEEVGSCDEQE